MNMVPQGTGKTKPRALPRLAVPALLGLVLGACERPPDTLEQVRRGGELVVATRNSATSYYEGADGPTGFEYDLARRFADRLGVELRLVVPENFADILPLVARGEVHLAAAGLSATEPRRALVRFGPAYQQITPQLVHRAGTPPPADLDDLAGTLEVVAGSSHTERLRRLRARHPGLTWRENTRLESEELLYLVWDGVIDYTVSDSNEVAINRHYYPELRVALDLGPPEPLAWAFPHDADDSLYRAAREFFEDIRRDGTLAQLLERHYGHVQRFDYVGTKRYMEHIRKRLPRYQALFMKAGAETGVDWRLLAAMGYQESHWNPRAISPTGVRGIMMVTLRTMRQLGLDNRLDPEQSILGGGRYFSMIRERLPERITEPDRTWLALAAYNIGFGHLEDARVLTEGNGGNPDKWLDVKEHLPLLSRKKWYRQTRHGYARGREPVQYVGNIRSYYDILVWWTERERPQRVESDMPPAVSPLL